MKRVAILLVSSALALTPALSLAAGNSPTIDGAPAAPGVAPAPVSGVTPFPALPAAGATATVPVGGTAVFSPIGAAPVVPGATVPGAAPVASAPAADASTAAPGINPADGKSVPVLAPVDPLAWAVANSDLGPYGGAQADSLRKIVNGQVAAHQASCSYTDPKTRAVVNVKCYDPANCVVCSKKAGDAGKKLQREISGAASSSAGQASIYQTMASYAQARADALNEQAKWNELRNQQTITETTTVDGETKTVTKDVKVENAADKESRHTAQVMSQLAAAAQVQAQQQGSVTGTYVNAAASALQKPQPATLTVGASAQVQ